MDSKFSFRATKVGLGIPALRKYSRSLAFNGYYFGSGRAATITYGKVLKIKRIL